MEREKIIEEMKLCADSAYYNWDNTPKDPVWRICEGLYDACYRKVPDGAVVLTREEMETTDKIPQKIKDFYKWFIEIEKEQACKETAEKILDLIDNESNGQAVMITNLIRRKYGMEVKK